ncbi:procathepsin L-like [Oppia nitens]|uniref:procathepsin L-like n=1 Tax=Oppia nitens TaxID=1686743 RepID=UPI0023DBED53|nr:procathepsin L-like [Oppia nitens]
MWSQLSLALLMSCALLGQLSCLDTELSSSDSLLRADAVTDCSQQLLTCLTPNLKNPFTTITDLKKNCNELINCKLDKCNQLLQTGQNVNSLGKCLGMSCNALDPVKLLPQLLQNGQFIPNLIQLLVIRCLPIGGLTTEALYQPRVNYTRGDCDIEGKEVYGKSYAFGVVKPGDEQALQEAVATIGPISVCIQCPKGFWFYKGGITDDPNCKSDLITVDHCVLVVGYGTDTKTKQNYWLVKSSSGENWGEDGYVRMARNKHNQCAIATQAVYPVVTPV